MTIRTRRIAAARYFAADRRGAWPASKSSCATTARRSTGTASSPRSSPNTSRRLENSFSCWRNRLGFVDSFRISRAESGFPVFQNVLELENDRRQAEQRLANIPPPASCATKWPTSSCATRNSRRRCRSRWPSGSIWRTSRTATIFGPFMLAETAKVSVNPKTMRPYYLVHWASLRRRGQPAADLHGDGRGFLRSDGRASWSTTDGKLNDKVDIPLPVDGLLNPELAHRFDDFTEKNSAYTLSPATIAINLDKDFESCIPSSCAASCSGRSIRPAITENNSAVTEVLSKVRKPENAWLLTWTIQEVYSKGERPGRKGLWSSEKATQEFYINTDDLEAARQGVSSYEKHALIPHEAYQALYAAGEAQKIFVGYKVHILSKGQVISDV